MIRLFIRFLVSAVACCCVACSNGSSDNSSGSPVVDGYMDKLSYNPGESASIYVNARISGKVTLGLYSLSGDIVDTIQADVTPQQITTQRPWEEGYGYARTVSYQIPTLKSGMYLWENKIPFIVKDPSSTAEMVVVYPTNTQNAYNNAGGKSLYTPENDRATTVSFQRPFTNFVNSYALDYMKWQFGTATKPINFVADRDMDDYSTVAGAKLIVLIGHSEYWTRQARLNFDRFIDAGGNALILSGNTMWWQVRYSDDGRKMICYKNSSLDPEGNQLLKTINWFESALAYPIVSSIGGQFDIGGYGRVYPDRGWDGFKIVTPSQAIFQGTGMTKGDILSLPSLEYDGTYLSGYDIDGYPILDRQKLGFYRTEIIGYDYGTRCDRETVGTWIALRKSPSSGIIINAASTDWAGSYGIGGPDSERVRKIVSNMTNSLLGNTYVFQEDM